MVDDNGKQTIVMPQPEDVIDEFIKRMDACN
jgi:hypothetical protein